MPTTAVTEEKIFDCIEKNGGRTAIQLKNSFGCEEDKMREILLELVKKRKIWPKNCIWEVRK